MLPDTMAQFGIMPSGPGGLQGLLDKLRGASIGKGQQIAQGAGRVAQSMGGGFGAIGGGALSGGATGAQIGSMIAPGVGTAIGAGVGAVAGALSGGMDWRKEQEQKQLQALMALRNR